MEIRAFEEKDIEPVVALYNRFYSSDGTKCTDFTRDFLCAFTAEDDNGIISIGGVRLIAEACLVTNKDRTTRERVKALREILKVSGFIARDHRFDWLHAITDDPTWAHQMRQNGFVDRGVDLLIHVGDIK